MPVDILKEETIETYKSLIQLSIEGMKFLALLNGGASVAILAYLGNVVSKGGSAPDMRWPMAFFLGGLICCGTSFLFTYITQLRVYEEAIGEPPAINSFHWRAWIRLAVTFAFLSIVLFSIGSFFAVWLFK